MNFSDLCYIRIKFSFEIGVPVPCSYWWVYLVGWPKVKLSYLLHLNSKSADSWLSGKLTSISTTFILMICYDFSFICHVFDLEFAVPALISMLTLFWINCTFRCTVYHACMLFNTNHTWILTLLIGAILLFNNESDHIHGFHLLLLTTMIYWGLYVTIIHHLTFYQSLCMLLHCVCDI